ncbi:uncharacterized protein [Ptychodera flava]|uniref:uncharacterized protein n=1 Tax=Ptychodera flava TaxID=63121 RepID=UPI00396A9370
MIAVGSDALIYDVVFLIFLVTLTTIYQDEILILINVFITTSTVLYFKVVTWLVYLMVLHVIFATLQEIFQTDKGKTSEMNEETVMNNSESEAKDKLMILPHLLKNVVVDMYNALWDSGADDNSTHQEQCGNTGDQSDNERLKPQNIFARLDNFILKSPSSVDTDQWMRQGCFSDDAFSGGTHDTEKLSDENQIDHNAVSNYTANFLSKSVVRSNHGNQFKDATGSDENIGNDVIDVSMTNDTVYKTVTHGYQENTVVCTNDDTEIFEERVESTSLEYLGDIYEETVSYQECMESGCDGNLEIDEESLAIYDQDDHQGDMYSTDEELYNDDTGEVHEERLVVGSSKQFIDVDIDGIGSAAIYLEDTDSDELYEDNMKDISPGNISEISEDDGLYENDEAGDYESDEQSDTLLQNGGYIDTLDNIDENQDRLISDEVLTVSKESGMYCDGYGGEVLEESLVVGFEDQNGIYEDEVLEESVVVGFEDRNEYEDDVERFHEDSTDDDVIHDNGLIEIHGEGASEIHGERIHGDTIHANSISGIHGNDVNGIHGNGVSGIGIFARQQDGIYTGNLEDIYEDSEGETIEENGGDVNNTEDGQNHSESVQGIQGKQSPDNVGDHIGTICEENINEILRVEDVTLNFEGRDCDGNENFEENVYEKQADNICVTIDSSKGRIVTDNDIKNVKYQKNRNARGMYRRMLSKDDTAINSVETQILSRSLPNLHIQDGYTCPASDRDELNHTFPQMFRTKMWGQFRKKRVYGKFKINKRQQRVALDDELETQSLF